MLTTPTDSSSEVSFGEHTGGLTSAETQTAPTDHDSYSLPTSVLCKWGAGPPVQSSAPGVLGRGDAWSRVCFINGEAHQLWQKEHRLWS